MSMQVMPTTAVTSVRVGKLDLTDLVESFSYEESTEKDNLLEIVVKDGYGLELSDNSALVPGAEVRFQFGYLGALSPVHTCIISDLDTKYSGRVVLTIKATDKGATLKKGQSDKIWKGVTGSQAAAQIAKKYGLKSVIDKSSQQIEETPQSGKTDFEILRDFASKETGGHYQAYVLGDTLFYVKRNLAKKSSLTCNYAAGQVLDFAPRWRESSVDAGANEVKTIGVDPKKNKVVSSTDSATDGSTLSKVPLVVRNSNADFIKIIPGTGTAATRPREAAPAGNTTGWSDTAANVLDTGKKLLSPAPASDSKGKGKHKKNKEKIKILEASLELPLTTGLRAGSVLTMAGVAKRHAGNWYVMSVRHKLGGSAARTSVTLGKESVKKGPKTAVTSPASNETVGPKDTSTKKVVRVVYNSDGERVARIQDGNKRPLPLK